MKINDNNFPNGIATVCIKLKKRKWILYLKYLFSSDLLNIIFNISNDIILYHTKEDEETWKHAHIPQKLKDKLRKDSSFDFMNLHQTGFLILGKYTGNFMIELMKIKRYIVNKGYNNAILLKLVKDFPNKSYHKN